MAALGSTKTGCWDCGSSRQGNAGFAIPGVPVRLVAMLGIASAFCMATSAMGLIVYQCFSINLIEETAITVEHVANSIDYLSLAKGDQQFHHREGFRELDARSQHAYTVLYESMFLERSSVTISGFSGDELCGLAYAVWYDSPELFYVNPAVVVHTITTKTMGEHSISNVTFEYLFCAEALASVRADFDRGVKEAAAAAADCPLATDKVSVLHVWLLDHVDYDERAANSVMNVDGWQREAARDGDQNEAEHFLRAATAYGALMDGKALCGGYSQLFCGLCRAAGIECRTIIGSIDGSGVGHAWNAVLINGEWLYIDSTWNDETDNHRAYYLATKAEFEQSGHWAYAGNIPPLDEGDKESA